MTFTNIIDDQITFTYCTTRCDKKVFEYPESSNEHRHNLYKCHMKYPWWQRFTGTMKDAFELSTTGHTIIPCTFDGAKALIPDGDKEIGTFIQAQIILLDYDDCVEYPYTKIKALQEAGINVNYWNGSFSYTPEKLKYRIAIKLDKPVTNADDFRKITRYLVRAFDYDLKPVAPNSYFYGGKGDGQYFNDDTTSVEYLLKLSGEYFKSEKITKKQNKTTVTSKTSTTTKTALPEALAQLITIAPLLDASHPWRQIAVDNEWLSHDAIFAVSASICRVEGGADYMRDYVNQWDYPNHNQLESKLRFIDEFEEGTREATGYFTYKAIDSSKVFSQNGEFDSSDGNCWDLLTVLEKFNSIVRSAYDGGNGIWNEKPTSVFVEIGTENQKTISIYNSYCQSHTKNDIDKTRGQKHTSFISSPTQLTVTGINDLFAQHQKVSSCQSVKEKLANIVTAKSIDYEELLVLPLFKAFVDGSIATETRASEFHKELIYGLFALTQRVVKDGKEIRVRKFINETAKAIPDYADRNRNGNVRFVNDLIKKANGAINSNKERYGISKCLPDKDNDGIYSEFRRIKAVAERRAKKDKERAENIKPSTLDIDYITADECRKDLNADEGQIVNLPIGVTVMEYPTGAGKSTWEARQVLNADKVDLARYVVAKPTHVLKNQTRLEWVEKGLVEGEDFIVTPSITDYLPEKSTLRSEISFYYDNGLYPEVKRILRALEPSHPAYAGANEYLDKEDSIKDFPGAILTTHAKVINFHSVSHDGQISDYFAGRDIIIIDEDPIKSIYDTTNISISDIKKVRRKVKSLRDKSNNEANFDKYNTTLSFLQDMESMAVDLRDDYDDAGDEAPYIPFYSFIDLNLYNYELLYATVKMLAGSEDVVKSKVLELGQHQVMMYTGAENQVTAGRLKPVNFDGKKVVVMSGTPNKHMLEGCFDNINYRGGIVNVEMAGAIYQVNTKATSKSGMTNKDGSLTDRGVNIVTSSNVDALVACKSVTQEVRSLAKDKEVLHYPAEGSNSLKGCSIVCLMKYTENPYSLLMKSLLVGARPTTLRRTHIKDSKCEDGRTFTAYTFEDELMRKLDIYETQSAFIQALGRARLLDNQVTVFYLSNVPIPNSIEITLDEFFHIAKINKSGININIDVVLGQDENRKLYQGLGLIDSGNKLTELGRKLLPQKYNIRSENISELNLVVA